MGKEPGRTVTARGWILAAAASLALAACGGNSAAERSAPPQTENTDEASTPSDPLEGEWRTEFTCSESVEAIQRRLSPKQIHEQVGTWQSFLGGWGAKPTSKDPCHQASGTTSLLVRFAEGNLALCDAETSQCEVNASYELVGKQSIRVDDPEGNLCDTNCPVKWRFDLTGDELSFRVSPDAFVISAWEASSWTRES